LDLDDGDAYPIRILLRRGFFRRSDPARTSSAWNDAFSEYPHQILACDYSWLVYYFLNNGGCAARMDIGVFPRWIF